MRLSDESLRGRVVIGADGQVIGSLRSVLVETTEWRVDAICVELRKDIADRIGASRSVFHRGVIEVPVRLVQSVGDAVVLAAGVDALAEARRAAAPEATPPA